MGQHAKEYEVFFKGYNGKPYKEFSVIKNGKHAAEIQGKRFGVLYDKEFSHVELINNQKNNEKSSTPNKTQ